MIEDGEKMKKGITLLEVLVTLVIISIITGLATVTVVGYLSKAKKDADEDTLILFNQLLLSTINNSNPQNTNDVKEVFKELGYEGNYSPKEKGKVYVWNNHTNKVELILENHFQDKDASYNVDYENDCFYVSYRNINYYLLDHSFMNSIYNLTLNDDKAKINYSETSLFYHLIMEYLNKTHFYNGIGTFYQYTLTERIKSRVTPTNIQVLEGVERLYTSSFQTCRKIHSIRVASSVTVISECVFISCTNLKSVTFNDNSTLKEIGNEAFFNCKVLDKITLPDSVEILGDFVFSNCHRIKYIGLSKELRTIGQGNFKNCKLLEKIDLDFENINFVLRDGVLYSSDYSILCAYPAQKYDAVFTVSNEVKEILTSAFSSNNHLQQLYVSSSVEILGEHFAENCEKLEYVLIPSVKTIQKNSFYGCFSLVTVDIPDGIEKIEQLAFAQCINLKSIYIPNTVLEIQENAFKSCKKLVISTSFSSLPENWVTDFSTFSVDIKYNQLRQ